MFTIEKTENGWFRVLKDGHLEAVVPDKIAVRKTLLLLQLKQCNR